MDRFSNGEGLDTAQIPLETPSEELAISSGPLNDEVKKEIVEAMHRIIENFSEGLLSNPDEAKAEELLRVFNEGIDTMENGLSDENFNSSVEFWKIFSHKMFELEPHFIEKMTNGETPTLDATLFLNFYHRLLKGLAEDSNFEKDLQNAKDVTEHAGKFMAAISKKSRALFADDKTNEAYVKTMSKFFTWGFIATENCKKDEMPFDAFLMSLERVDDLPEKNRRIISTEFGAREVDLAGSHKLESIRMCSQAMVKFALSERGYDYDYVDSWKGAPGFEAEDRYLDNAQPNPILGMWQNIDMMDEIDSEYPKGTAILNGWFNIVNFRRYDKELLIDQLKNREDTSRPYGIVMITDSDWNDAFGDRQDIWHSLKKDLGTDYDVRFIEAGEVDGLVELLSSMDYQYNKEGNNKIKFACICGHGSKKDIDLNRNLETGDSKNLVITNKILKNNKAGARLVRRLFDKDAPIVLGSCNSGAGEHSFAETLSDTMERRVHSTQYKDYIASLKVQKKKGKIMDIIPQYGMRDSRRTFDPAIKK